MEGKHRPAERTLDRASKTRVRHAPQGATASRLSRALERAPEITILTDPVEIGDRQLKDGPLAFYGAVQTLFVKGLYPVVERMADELSDEFVATEDPEEARGGDTGRATNSRPVLGKQPASRSALD